MSRVLLVSESPTESAAFTVLLEDAGFEVVSVWSAENGHAELANSTFELVLTDLTLPGPDGIEFCRRIKLGPQAIDVPVVVLTRSGDVASVLRSLEAGANGFVAKSADERRIVDAIQQALARRTSTEQQVQQQIRFRGDTFNLRVNQDRMLEIMLAAFEDLSELVEKNSELNEQLEIELRNRQEAERTLLDSEAIYHSLVDNVPVSMIRKDLEGRFVFANEPSCNELGCPLEKIRGRTDYDFFPRDLAEKYRANDRAVIETGEVFEDVERHETPDGRQLYVQVMKAPVTDAEGDTIGVQVVYWDVTGRHKSEEELRQSEARKQAIFDSSLDCMIISDANGRIVEFNQTAERTFGYRRDEMLGMQLEELVFPPEEQARARENMRRYASDREEGMLLGRRLEMPVLKKNGERFIAEITMQPIPLGETAQIATVLHDITRRKQRERELQQARDAADAANMAKSSFLANMSHEIRTPMNAIIGMTELVLDSILPREQHEHLRVVQDSAESLLDVINDILDFTRIEAGKLDLDNAPFSLRDRVGDTMKSIAIRAHRKRLELACRILPEVPDSLIGDAGRLRQVLVNLVGNAIKFTPRGEVVLSVRQLEVTNDDVALHFAVRDTGVGIPNLKQRAIFRAFEQADTSTTRQFGGTGLGLAISARLVELMDGRIWIDSEEGQGSTFHFTTRFKIATAEDAAQAKPSGNVIGRKIAVVDDNATNRTILSETLGNWGMVPVVFATAEDALAQRDVLAGASLIVTDVQMPAMDGFQFSERLRQDEQLRNIPVIMLTSADRSGDIARCRVLGISRYMTQPVKQSELLAAIETCCETEPLVAERGAAAQPAPHKLRRPLKVLLVEDSPTNQLLAAALLEREGHAVEIAGNGLEAVELATSRDFDVILMDVQMPEMDGYEATRRIREQESKRVPIIATTAHAMKGDRDKCLASGMDEYISKPIRATALFGALDRVEQPTAQDMIAASSAETPGCLSNDRVDWIAALRAVGGDRGLLRSVIAAVLEECPRLQKQLGEAVRSGNATGVRYAAHTVKGTIRPFDVSEVDSLATRLEQMAIDQDLSKAEAAFTALCDCLEMIYDDLRSFNASDSVPDD